MAYNLKYNTGMIENPISFRDTNVTKGRRTGSSCKNHNKYS